MYKKAFLSAQLGYGSTIAVIIALLSFAGVLLVNRATAASRDA
jgi:ABC-type sugar transport system permease subunit